MKYTRKQLIKAMQLANREYLLDIPSYDPITDNVEYATGQIDDILKFIK